MLELTLQFLCLLFAFSALLLCAVILGGLVFCVFFALKWLQPGTVTVQMQNQPPGVAEIPMDARRPARDPSEVHPAYDGIPRELSEV